MIDPSWISDLKLEKRNCGTARAIMMIVENPSGQPKEVPYCELLTLAFSAYKGIMGEDGRVMRDADVMAWSEDKKPHMISAPHLYRVNATFVYKEELQNAESEEE